MGRNFDDYPDFQKKARGCNNMRNTLYIQHIPRYQWHSMASLVEQNEGQGEKSVVWPLSGFCLAFVWPLSGLGLALVRVRFGIWSVLGRALVRPWLGLGWALVGPF